jgi:hypothetical protein
MVQAMSITDQIPKSKAELLTDLVGGGALTALNSGTAFAVNGRGFCEIEEQTGWLGAA